MSDWQDIIVGDYGSQRQNLCRELTELLKEVVFDDYILVKREHERQIEEVREAKIKIIEEEAERRLQLGVSTTSNMIPNPIHIPPPPPRYLPESDFPTKLKKQDKKARRLKIFRYFK